MNSFIVTIEARLGSKRLPGKVLFPFGNMKALDLLIYRIKKSKFVKKIVVATTNQKSDDELVFFLKRKKINFFRGSESNVLKRLYQATKNYKENTIIQLTADNPLIDHRVIDCACKFYIKNSNRYDFVTTSNIWQKETKIFPLGMNVSIFKKLQFKKLLGLATNKSQLEHPTLTFYREGKALFNSFCLAPKKKWQKKYLPRLTLDTFEDYLFLINIYYGLDLKKNVSLTEILTYLEKNKNLMNINKTITQKLPKLL